MNHDKPDINSHTMRYTFERCGSKIHYWITEGHHTAKPTVIFTHGASLDHHMFDTQINALKNAGYPMLTWDVRGHGLSKPIGELFDFRIAVEDLLEIMKRHALHQVILVGHSFGGYVSQQITFQYPERVVALAVIGCTDITEKPSWMMRMAYRNMARIFRLIPDDKLRKQFAEGMGVTQLVQDYSLHATKRLEREEFIQIMAKGVEPLRKDSRYGRGYVIPKPFLLTIGEQDSAGNGVFLKNAPDWAKREPNVHYEMIPNAGHNANQDNPEYFNPILLNFMNNVTEKMNE